MEVLQGNFFVLDFTFLLSVSYLPHLFNICFVTNANISVRIKCQVILMIKYFLLLSFLYISVFSILGAFYAAVKQGFNQNLHAVFCLAENSVGERSTRPDDIHTMYSGKTVEINNTVRTYSKCSDIPINWGLGIPTERETVRIPRPLFSLDTETPLPVRIQRPQYTRIR